MAIAKIILNGVTQMDVTQDTVAAGNLLTGYTATGADGESVTGSVTVKTAQSYTPSSVAQVIPAGQYLGGDQTIEPIPSYYGLITYDNGILTVS